MNRSKCDSYLRKRAALFVAQLLQPVRLGQIALRDARRAGWRSGPT